MERARRPWGRLLFAMATLCVAYTLSSQALASLRGPSRSSSRMLAQQQQQADASSELLASAVPALVDAFLASPLPPRNLNISEEAPLFFFHQRKTAGSSVRQAIVDSAARANLTSFVACFNNVSCDTYVIGTHKAAVYAGHLLWGEQRELSRRATFDAATGTWRNPRHSASCLTMFRDPLARLESCYYYRFVQERRIRTDHFRCMSKLSPAELRSMYANGRSIYGRGCLNEPFRILSGLTDEVDIAGLSTSPTTRGSSLTAAMTLTLSHLSTCVPLVLEDPRSLRLVRHWFPQLAPAFTELKQVRKGKVSRCPLTARTRAVLEELSVGERMLYDAAQRRMEVMLAQLPPEEEEEEQAAVVAAEERDVDHVEEESTADE